MNLDVLLNHDDGLTTHDVQKHRLGQVGLDQNGDRWSYVQFFQAVNAGEYVRDAIVTDLLSADPGTATAISAVGTDLIVDAGEFTDDDFVGAVGMISGTTLAQGIGQTFRVVEMVDANTIRVYVLADGLDPILTGGKWATALAVGSEYRLYFPGRVYEGDASSLDIVRGIVQIDIAAPTAGSEPYGWVKQSGLGYVLLDDGNDPPVLGERIIPSAAAGGMVEGLTAGGTTADEAAARVIGHSVLGDYTDAVGDRFVMVDLDIINNAVSYKFPNDENPYNANTIS